ncbi:MAG: hypothetical protein GC205_03010 [Bacteroidetes bacterium]|nr:hypothetical protein [Bacteroidota bacterium]
MKGRSEYRIPFVGLQVGIHYFNFEVGDAFFESFEGSLVQQGKVFVDLALEKRDRVMTLTFDIGGQVHVECDRCLAPLQLPIHGHFKVYVKTGREGALEDEDVIIIGPEETHLDIEQHMYEFIQLSVPMLQGCEELPLASRPCNLEVLRRLQGQNLDPSDETEIKAPKKPEETIHQDLSKPVDPRWDKLRSLEGKE